VPVKIKPYIAENPYTAKEYKARMTAALDDETREALAKLKNADLFKAKEAKEDQTVREFEQEEYEGGVKDVTPKKKKRVGFEKKKTNGPSEFDSNASDSAPQEGSIQRRNSDDIRN